MSLTAVPGRRAARPFAAAAALACALGLLAGAPPAAAQTERVREAERGVEDARSEVEAADRLAAELSARLDGAAARYEHANAHRLRLTDEADDIARASVTAELRAEHVEGRFAEQVAGLYKNPTADLTLAGAVVLAPDATTAVHRAALVERLAVRERLRVDRALDGAALAEDVQRQQQVVAAGVLGAEEESRQLAEDLQVALAGATHQVEQARATLTDAEAELERVEAEEQRRIEAERRAAEAERRAAEIAARGSGPPPPVDGKVCPIGSPNAFIDSWGFPRSGGRRHQGVDMFAAYGMPLYAVADGTIRRVWNNRLGGLSVDLLDDHGDRYYYAHLSATSVSAGQRVRAGDVVGANGNSGNARTTPPHLHWQYHPGNGPAVNPYPLARALCR